MALNKVEICGVDTSKLPLLKEDEKKELFARIKQGDKEAKEEYIKGNLRLVLSVIKRFGNSNENVDDLFQIGCVGLIKAINNFNTELDVKFSTYAVPMVIICRNTRKEVSQMTRKTALNQAIYILSQSEGNEEIIEKLQDLLEELPLIHWSDKSIHDRVQQFIEDNGRNPTTTDFKKKGMPPHTVIKQKYGIILTEWLEKFYPTVRPSPEAIRKEYSEEFIREYSRIKPRSADEYEAKRSKGAKSWQTVRFRCGQKSWRGLIRHLELPVYFDMAKDHVPIKFNIQIKTDLREELKEE